MQPSNSEHKTIAQRNRVKKQHPFVTKLVALGDRMAFDWKVREALYRHLSSQMSNGVALDRALESFRARLLRKKKVTSDRIIGEISRRMRDGSTFTDAISPWIPQDEAAIIQGGEMSGNLPKSFALATDAKRRIDRVKTTLKSSLISPGVYIAAVYAMLWAIGRFVMPSLEQVLPKAKATGLIAGLYTAGDFANSMWAVLPPIAALLIVMLIILSLPKWTGAARIRAENYFPYSFYRDLNGYAWLMTFSSLLRAGMVDVEILNRQMKTASPWLKERLHAIWYRMQNGNSLSEALMSKGKKGMPPFGFPNPNIIDDISSLHGFPEFPEKVATLAIDWSEELETITLARAKSIGFWIEMFMYGVMGLLMVAINSMSTQIGNVSVAM